MNRIERNWYKFHPPLSPIGSWVIYLPAADRSTGYGYSTAPIHHRTAPRQAVRLVQVMRVLLIQQVSHSSYSALHIVLPSSLMSASAVPGGRSDKGELFAQVNKPAYLCRQPLHRQPALRQPRPAPLLTRSARISPSSLSSILTSPAGTPHRDRPHSLPAVTSPPASPLRFIQFAVLCLDADERPKLPGWYTVWIRVVSVCTVVAGRRPIRTTSPPVYATATSICQITLATPHPFPRPAAQRVER